MGRGGWKTKRGGELKEENRGEERTVTSLSALSLHRLEAHRHLPDHCEASSASSQHHQILPHGPAASLKTSLPRTPQQQQPFSSQQSQDGKHGEEDRDQMDEEEYNRDEQKERR